MTSPARMLSPSAFIWYCTASCMAPRWTGMCGALHTRPPSGPNKAHEKSSRSLMFVEMAVLCKILPICSAMLMNRCEKSDRRTASSSRPIFSRAGWFTVMQTSPCSKTCA
uniref:Putative secreted protein n=1 Tax=Ixodes ricinus TaxID=34613 RepID=A0A6B0UJ01_IXORI